MKKIILSLVIGAMLFSVTNSFCQTNKNVIDVSLQSDKGNVVLIKNANSAEKSTKKDKSVSEKDKCSEKDKSKCLISDSESTKELNVLGEENLTACLKANEETLNLGGKAKSSCLVDADTGMVIFSKNENDRLTIASMTKIMLLNLVFEAVENGELKLDEKITVSQTASDMGGSQVFLQANKEYVCSDLIKSVIVASANDASVALAERLFGSEEACVNKMNEKRNEMGLKNTLFSNCTGLPKPTQYSSAKDVSLMISKLVKFKDYFKFSKIWLEDLVHPDGKTTTITNTNKLVRFYNGCDGGKTGFTNESGFCLAATAKRGALRLISVVIGEPDSKQRFGDVSKMFDYGFATFTQSMIVDATKPLEEDLQVKFCKTKTIKVIPEESVFDLKGKNEKHNYDFDLSFDENLCAPISKGDVVGKITVFKDGIELKEVNVVAFENAERLSYFDCIKEVLQDYTFCR